MTLHEFADELLEIRLHVHVGVDFEEEVRRRLAKLFFGESGFQSKLLPDRVNGRLRTNISSGIKLFYDDPEVLKSYLYAAAAEIRELAATKEGPGK